MQFINLLTYNQCCPKN